MLTREALITRINASLAWLESYLKLNAAGNLNTSSVLAEDLCIRLLNLVYGHRLKNANADQLNAPAVDLVLAGHIDGPRLAYQITINDKPAKISDTHKLLASHPDVAERFDSVIILFLVRKAPAAPKAYASFTPCTRPAVRSLDLAGIVEDIRALPLERIEVIADALNEEMKRRDHAPHLPAPAPAASEAPPPAPGFLQFLTRSWTDLAKALACLAAVIIIPALLGVEPGSSTGLIAIGIAAVPLLCYLLLDALPRWREARYLIPGSTLWRKARPWLVPGFIAALLGGFVLFSAYQEKQALHALSAAGFSWREDVREATPLEDKKSELVSLHAVGEPLKILNCRSLDLSRCAFLISVDGLKGLTSLQTLELTDCDTLTRVDVPEGLTSLRTLKLSHCDVLARVDVREGLTSLQTLNLSFCPALARVDGLKGLTSLHSLNLSDCDVLPSVDVLEGLTSLQSLNLSFCDTLPSVEPLKELRSLRELNLLSCPKIPKEQITALKAALPDCEILSDYDK